ncbi:MAG: tetratricopeptide repeat protein [Terriglobia bacterium]
MDRGAQLDRNRFHPREAEPEYRAALDTDPTNAFAHLVLGDVLEWIGQRDPAISEFREAVRLQPDMAEAHLSLADTLYRKKDRQEAFAEFDRALALAPDDARIHRIYAISWKRMARNPRRRSNADSPISYLQAQMSPLAFASAAAWSKRG